MPSVIDGRSPTFAVARGACSYQRLKQRQWSHGDNQNNCIHDPAAAHFCTLLRGKKFAAARRWGAGNPPFSILRAPEAAAFCGRQCWHPALAPMQRHQQASLKRIQRSAPASQLQSAHSTLMAAPWRQELSSFWCNDLAACCGGGHEPPWVLRPLAAACSTL